MFLTQKEVAARYKVTPDCITKWVRADKFPKPVKLNGATRWKVEDLEQWESAQSQLTKKQWLEADKKIRALAGE